MRKVYYIYNPQTQTYDRIYPTVRQRALSILRRLFIGMGLGAGSFIVLLLIFGSPSEKELRKENSKLQAQYNVLSRRLDEAMGVLQDIQPVSNKDLRKTASGYGTRIDPIYGTSKFHEGMDFSAPQGTDVYATGDGTVVQMGWQSGYGNRIVIDHGFGYQTVYAHLRDFRTKLGKKVVRGEVIGGVGSTGKSTGPHLHYEVHVKGKVVNPVNYYFMDLSAEDYDRMIQIAANNGKVLD